MKSILKYFVLSNILLILSIYSISAAHYLVHTYDQDSGMPNSYVTSMTQDSNGIIWAITQRGLTSYDGINWKQYISPNNQKGKLDQIAYIKVDEAKNLWVVQLDSTLSIYKFNDGNKQVNSVKSIFISSSKILSKSHYHLNTTSGNLTFATIIPDIGIYVLTNNKWHVYNKSTGITDLDFISVYTVGSTVYFSNRAGFYKIENGIISKDLTYHYFGNKQIVLAMNSIKSQSSNILWILTDKQIGSIEQGKFQAKLKNLNIIYNNRQKYYSLIPNYFNTIIWGSALDIRTYNIDKGVLGRLDCDNGLIDNGSSGMFIDREQILWIASYRGISKVSSCRFMNSNKYNGLLDNEVSAIIERSPNNYIFGHRNGITIWDGKNLKTKLFDRENSYERVNYFVKDNSGNVWASAYKNGIAKIDKNNNITWIPLKEFGLEEVSGIAADGNGRILFSSNNDVYEIISNKPKKIISGGDLLPHIRGLYFDRNNSLYITTALKGLFKYANNRFEQFLPADKSNANANDVYSVFFDTDGRLLVGTKDGLYQAVNGKLIRTGLNDRALNKFIYFIIKDREENYWFGTEVGLVRYNGKQYWNYGVREGLAGLETNRGAGIIDSRGRLLIGTNRGLSIYLKQYDVNRSIKPIVKLLNAEADTNVYSINQPMQFTSNSLNLVINYSVVSFYDEKKNTLKYKLEGNGESVDTDWQEVTAIEKNYIQYKDLKPGTYIFKIKAKNALGVWSDEIVSSRIEIIAPFDYTIIVILIVITSLLVIIFVSSKNSQNRRYGLKLEKEVEHRTAQLAQSERRYKQMFIENNAIMLIINPENGDIIDANPSAVVFFDLNKDDLLKKNIFEFNSSKEINRSIAIEVINSSKEINIDYIEDKTNDIHHLKAHLSEIDSDDRKLLYCIVDDTTDQVNAEKQLLEINENLESIVKNRTSELEEALDTLHEEITQRMEAEQGLLTTKNELEKSLIREKELNQLKSRFIMMVSHEYRTPLTVIFSSAELIKEFAKMGHIEACLDYAKRIQESVKTLTELLEGVMAIGDETEVQVFKEEFNFNEFVTYIINDLKLKTKSTHNIVFESIDNDLLIRQDRNLLKQVISQIISNSIKFSKKESDIILTNNLHKDKLIITIKDFGCGISEKDIEHIFEPFYKCQDAVGIISGTGLGLAIVKKNVQAIGGNIYAESELLKGTSIFIELPIK